MRTRILYRLAVFSALCAPALHGQNSPPDMVARSDYAEQAKIRPAKSCSPGRESPVRSRAGRHRWRGPRPRPRADDANPSRSQKTNRTVAKGAYKAEWSPDGRWIAALEHNDTERTLLFGAQTLREERALPTSDLHWSPDSRYLTLWKWQSVCEPEIYSLEKPGFNLTASAYSR
jgi:hypothetical protein